MKGINDKANIIGSNVRYYRKKENMSQQDLCDKLDLYGINLYRNDIYLIEYHKRIVKDYETLGLAKAFGITVDKLFKNTEKDLQ